MTQIQSDTAQTAVAVITRTKNRPIMLARVAETLRRQKFDDLDWVVVNDGGDPAPVEAVVATFRDAGGTARVLHNNDSIGMEAAANRGIGASRSRYIHIHDDDDTVEDGFYRHMVDRLETSDAMGVTANINRVFETIEEDAIRFLRLDPWDTGMPSISRMVCINRFVPISFLYRRAVHDRIGFYREDLQVCGDWEFYLRFLRHFDIVKDPAFLANYHIREGCDDAAMQNSISRRHVHQTADMHIRNSMIREELDRGTMGYAGLIALGAQLWDTEIKLYHMEQKGNELWRLKDRALDRIRRNRVARWLVLQ